MDNTFKNRRDISPKWITYIIVLIAFFYPIVLVLGDNNLFDFILKWIKGLTEPNAPFIYLLSYLLCFFILLIPSIVLIQTIGYYYIIKNNQK